MNALLGRGIAITICFSQWTSANSQIDMNKYELGLMAGMFIYQGDLTPSMLGSFKTPGFTGTIFLNRSLNESFSMRANLEFGRIAGNDGKYPNPAWRKERNFNFNSPLIELSALLVWNPLGKNRTLSPYVFGGAGLSWFNIRRDWSGFNAEFFTLEPNVEAGLQDDIAHAVPGILPVIPVGVGLRYHLTPRISLIAESSYRFTASDYIDGFSKAANPDRFDHYQNYSAGVVITLGKKKGIDCPDVKQ